MSHAISNADVLRHAARVSIVRDHLSPQLTSFVETKHFVWSSYLIYLTEFETNMRCHVDAVTSSALQSTHSIMHMHTHIVLECMSTTHDMAWSLISASQISEIDFLFLGFSCGLSPLLEVQSGLTDSQP